MLRTLQSTHPAVNAATKNELTLCGITAFESKHAFAVRSTRGQHRIDACGQRRIDNHIVCGRHHMRSNS